MIMMYGCYGIWIMDNGMDNDVCLVWIMDNGTDITFGWSPLCG